MPCRTTFTAPRQVAGPFALLVLWMAWALTGLALDPQEADCYRRLRGDEGTAVAQKEAQGLLEKRPGSFMGHYLLGQYYLNIGEYPRAVFQFSGARTTVERLANHAAPPAQGECQWHALVLMGLIETYGRMDRLQDQERVIGSYLAGGYDQYEELHEIGFGAKRRKFYLLCKLGRVREAGDLLGQIRVGQNEVNLDKLVNFTRDQAFMAFLQKSDGADALAEYRKLIQLLDEEKRSVDAVLLSTAAFHARRQGDYGFAEECLKKAQRTIEETSAVNAAQELSQLYVADARWPESQAALKTAWITLATRRGNIRQELRKDLRLAVAQFYLARGLPDRAWVIASPLLDDGLRAGYTTGSQEQWQAGRELVCWAALRQNALRCREILWADPFHAGWKLWWEALRSRALQVPREARFKACILRQEQGGLPIRDLLGLAYMPTWLWGDAIDILGPSIAEKLLQRYPLQGAQERMFRGFLQARIAYARKDYPRAFQLAGDALHALPSQNENLIRAELLAIRGRCLWISGSENEALKEYAAAYAVSPSVFRRLAIPLPVVVETDESEGGKMCRTAIARSPSLRTGKSGLRLTLSVGNGSTRCQLVAPNGSPLASFDIKAAQADDPKRRLQFSGELHRQIFCSLPPLKTGDYNACEGRAMPLQ